MISRVFKVTVIFRLSSELMFVFIRNMYTWHLFQVKNICVLLGAQLCAKKFSGNGERLCPQGEPPLLPPLTE